MRRASGRLDRTGGLASALARSSFGAIGAFTEPARGCLHS
ncbi:hypothetical protein LG3211_2285 [Lysobacter gummosus]|nr:hypothetical protein LG3211_2285 [Lysobacter gummosus]